jgi:hypothetical protein
VIQLLGPASAQATTTIHEFVRAVSLADTPLGDAGSDQNFEDWGIYFDDIAKLGGDWKFTRRLFVPMYIGPGVVTGQVLTPRSDLLRPGS